MITQAIVAVSLLSVATVAAQQPIKLGDTPTCRTCKITLEPAVRLIPGESEGFAPGLKLAYNSKDQYFVSSTTFIGQINVYGPDGRFQRSIGRKGLGPGEFNSLEMMFFDARDSLHVLEGNSRRYQVFAPDLTLAHAGQMRATRIMDYLVHPSGSIVASPGGTAEDFRPLQFYTRAGDPQQAVGPRGVATDLGATIRWLSLDQRGNIWALSAGRYMLEQYSPAGELLHSYTAGRDWIVANPPPMGLRLDLRTEKPPPQFAGAMADNDRVWVFVMVPDANWKPMPDAQTMDFTKVWDTLVEVFDIRTGALVTRVRFDPMVLPLRGFRAYALVEDAVGEITIQVSRLKLSQN